jgi:hypothetical protein
VSPATPAARYGFRRVECVHLRVTAGGAVATVTGTAHRYPRSVRVPLTVAHRLIAAGIPVTVERDTPWREAVVV